MLCDSRRAATAVSSSISTIPFYHLALGIVIGVLLTFIQSACQSGYEKNSTDSDGSSRQEERAGDSDFEITIASGGGVTGLYSGYTLFSDGRVDHWKRFPGKEQTIVWTTKEEPGRIDTLRNQLVRSGMLGKTHQETGNMTVSASYRVADSDYTWSWDANDADDLPAELERWYAAVKEFCDEMENKTNE